MSLLAITRQPGRRLSLGEVTHIERTPVDVVEARRQHAAYEAALREAGVLVESLAPNDELPDSTFVEDTAIVTDELAVVTALGAESRVREADLMEPVLRVHREVVRMRRPASMDGGDVLRIGRTFFVGLTARTNEAGVAYLADALRPYGYEVRTVEVSGALHLKTAGTYLPNQDLLLANRDWVDPGAFGEFADVVRTAPDEPFGANALVAGERIFLAASAPRMLDALVARGIAVAALDISEFQKMEAGMTCLSLLLHR
jgi:dimethylargininase